MVRTRAQLTDAQREKLSAVTAAREARLAAEAEYRRAVAAADQAKVTKSAIAEAAGVSKGFLSRLERDLTSPSVSTLVTLCQVLGASPGDVLDAPEVTVVRLADAPAVSLGGEGIRERLITPRGSRDLQILRADIAPRGRGEAELYTVDCRVEAVHVVTGRLELRTTEAVHLLEEGDTVTFPGREPHSWANPDDRPAVVLWTLVGHA